MTLAYAIITFGTTTGFFIWLFIYIFVLNPEKGEKLVKWGAIALSWTSKKAEKTATARGIQSKIESFVRGIETEVEDLIPFGLKIKWVSPEMTKAAFIQHDRVIVMLSHHKNQDENLAKATLLYINKAVIPDARLHIDKKLARSIDLMMTKKALFSFTEACSSVGHFVETVLRPETESDTELKKLCSAIDTIDERGLFTRILLRELMELGYRRAGITESGNSVHETNEFTKYLKRIAQKERGIDVNPTFIKNDIRVSIIFVARPDKLKTGRTKPYLDAINKDLKKSARTFYIFARTKKNIEFAKTVTNAALQKFDELAKGHVEEYPTQLSDKKIVTGYCAILYSRKM